MNTTTKVTSLAIMMFTMTGMLGIAPGAFADDVDVKGVGKGGYQLNLLGKDWSSDEEVECSNNGHRIFVPLHGKFKINLSEGDFAVLDCNATDKGNTAAFQLPNPIDLDGDGVTDPGLGCWEDNTCTIGYYALIRVLGTPGASIEVGPTCAQADLDGDGTLEDYCTTDDPYLASNANGKKGGAKFHDISKELLTICVDYYDDDVNGDGAFDEADGQCDERIALFDDDFENFMWNFDNNGARNTQLRFVIGVHTVG